MTLSFRQRAWWMTLPPTPFGKLFKCVRPMYPSMSLQELQTTEKVFLQSKICDPYLNFGKISSQCITDFKKKALFSQFNSHSLMFQALVLLTLHSCHILTFFFGAAQLGKDCRITQPCLTPEWFLVVQDNNHLLTEYILDRRATQRCVSLFSRLPRSSLSSPPSPCISSGQAAVPCTQWVCTAGGKDASTSFCCCSWSPWSLTWPSLSGS